MRRRGDAQNAGDYEGCGITVIDPSREKIIELTRKAKQSSNKEAWRRASSPSAFDP
jgi:hypothetical protein